MMLFTRSTLLLVLLLGATAASNDDETTFLRSSSRNGAAAASIIQGSRKLKPQCGKEGDECQADADCCGQRVCRSEVCFPKGTTGTPTPAPTTPTTPAPTTPPTPAPTTPPTSAPTTPPTQPSSSSSKNLRVFVLNGQSNAVGHACGAHFEWLTDNTQADYSFLGDSSNGWATRDDVFIMNYNDDDREPPGSNDMMYDNLNLPPKLVSVGNGDTMYEFGPETGLGWTLGDHYPDDDVLLLKIAWGGQSLAVDFRPPGTYDAGYNGDPSKLLSVEYSNNAYEDFSVEYNQTVNRVNGVMDSLSSIYGDTYGEHLLSGFIFFQGWNDFASSKRTKEYEYNLRNFIPHMRADIVGGAELPFVIGEMGSHGNLTQETNAGVISRATKIRQFQANVAADVNITRVELAETADIAFNRECANAEETTCNTGCQKSHYWNNAGYMYDIGVEMGQKMICLMDGVLCI